MKVLVCKQTGKEFCDLENKSGGITIHLEGLGVEVPTSYKRRKYLEQNKTPWHYSFFDIIERQELEYFFCKYCDWKTPDLLNNSGCYTTHLLTKHNKSTQDYLSEFPDESIKFKTYLNKIEGRNFTLQKDNHVTCKICGYSVRYLTNTHLKKHGITPEEYKIKYGTEYASKNFVDKSRKILSEAAKNIKKTYVSKPEKDLQGFLEEELGLHILKNDKKTFGGVEINIIIPDKKICIEFNGNLYHSENYGGKHRYFHLNKSNICREKGYRLIHIMEDEWFLKNEIVKEKLKTILHHGLKKSFYARQCTIKAISTKEKNEFLNNNHIQGEDKSEIYLGAFYKDELVSVITLSLRRKMVKAQEDGTCEIKRFASNIHYNVPGIFSKFLSFIKKNYTFQQVFTFLDLRWNNDSTNNVYLKNGFTLDSTIKPDYSYYNSSVSRYKRFHKFSFGKSSLRIKFPDVYRNELTEWEIMQKLRYDRIWDCGKYKFTLRLQDS